MQRKEVTYNLGNRRRSILLDKNADQTVLFQLFCITGWLKFTDFVLFEDPLSPIIRQCLETMLEYLIEA